MKVDVTAVAKNILTIEADAKLFGEMFAQADCEEQAKILKHMVEAMKPHTVQWDYIYFELEKPEYEGVAKTIIEALRGGDA